MSFWKQRKVRRTVAAISITAILMGMCIVPKFHISASIQKTGTITTEWIVETKQEPSPSAAKANGLEDGKKVTILEEVTGEDGKTWYQVAYVLKKDSSVIKAYVPAESVVIEEIVTYGKGIINKDDVYVRNEPGAGKLENNNNHKLISLYEGDSVELIEESMVDGVVWHRIRCVKDGITYVGWTSSEYIKIQSAEVESETKEEEVNFEDELHQKGFPESYIQKLLVLHKKYPNWVFEAVHTGLEWSDVINGETKPGSNLVQLTADDAKKSTASTEYDWTKNTWTIRDGAGWVTAHPDYIAHRMDPRNYLTETDIFQFESLAYNAAHNIQGVRAIIGNTFMKGTNGVVTHADNTSINYAETFMQVAKETNVSPYNLASRVIQEQGNGTSSLISGTYSLYPGVYNYFNIKATGDSKEQIYQNGLSYAKQQGWTTRYKALKGGAEFIASKYINVGQNTLYFQKFDVISQGGLYWHQYMTNVDGAYSEGKRVAKAYTDKKQAFVFNIPVYKNMPKEAASFTVSGNRNNYLKDISISDLSLSPTFKGDVTEYSLVVEHEVSSINISATPVVAKSTVSGTGNHELKVGINEIAVKCKSESGSTKTYTLTVVRQEAPKVEEPVMPEVPTVPEVPDKPQQPEISNKWTLTSDKYVIGKKNITGISPQTEVSTFLSGLKTDNCTLKIKDSSGKEKNGNVCTGDKLEIYCNNVLVMTHQIIIYGDVNGDSAVDVLDIIKMNRHTLGLSVLKDVYLEAGDANRKQDGVDVLDIIVTNRHTLGLATIKQK